MTWAKYRTEFWDDCANAGLSDAAVRTHAEAVSWLYRMEADDLVVKASTLRRWAGTEDPRTALGELVLAEFWAPVPGGWCLVHDADVVRGSLGAQRAKRARDKAAQKAARQRAEQRARAEGARLRLAPVSGGVNHDVSGGVNHDVSDGVSADVSAYPTNQSTTNNAARGSKVNGRSGYAGGPVDPW